MSDHHRATSGAGGPAPTAKQQSYLRRLAMERGVSFTPPRTRAEASAEIARLKAQPRTTSTDRRRELKAVRGDLAAGPRDAARVRDDEITGYGSSATWKSGER
jgi:hypothetical protein